MKATRYLFVAFVLATLALAACHNDDMPGGNTLPKGAVHITANIEGVQTRAPQLDADGEGLFDPADEWGMYTFTGDATSPAYSNENITYKADNSTPLYWEDLSETEAVTFSAYYPRTTGDITNPAAYMYIPEAWNNTDDLLHATATASKDGTVALTFKHLMHRLVINLTVGEGMTGTDLSSALINSVGQNDEPTMVAGVEVNLLTGAINYDRVEGAVQFSNGSSGNADWKVAPQNLTAGAGWLRIKVGEDTWYYNVPADLNTADPGNQTRLESGKRLTLNLTLKKNQQTGKTEVELTGSDISGWDDGGTITDEVAIGGAASGVTTYAALVTALKTGGVSAEAPTLVKLGGDITIPVGGDYNTPPITGSGYYKIDGGGHTLTWEENSYYYLGNVKVDADPVHIELTDIKLVQQGQHSSSSLVYVNNGSITLGGDVTLDGNGTVIMAYGEKAALELSDGCELSYTAGWSSCANVWNGATLVLNGGKTATGAYIALYCSTYSGVPPLISVPKALTDDVHLILSLTGIPPIAQGTGGYQLTQADCDRLIVNPESLVSLYGEPLRKYGEDFELYLAPEAGYQIKLRRKNLSPDISGNIDMTGMTADEAKAAITAAFDADITELKLTGDLAKTGMGGSKGIFVNNTQITKCDLTGVTGWGTPATLPDRAFMRCSALQEVTLPDDVQVIREYAFYLCNALTTVNLSNITGISEKAFRACTSLTALKLDNVTAIGLDAFWGCTGLETLKLPKCTRFDNYIVTGCRSLTRIEATAAGNFVDIDDDSSDIGTYSVFQNRSTHTGENAFNPAKCDLVLNADKKQDGTAAPKVSNGNEWTKGEDARPMQWKNITFAQP